MGFEVVVVTTMALTDVRDKMGQILLAKGAGVEEEAKMERAGPLYTGVGSRRRWGGARFSISVTSVSPLTSMIIVKFAQLSHPLEPRPVASPLSIIDFLSLVADRI